MQKTMMSLLMAALPLGSALAAGNVAPVGTASQSSRWCGSSYCDAVNAIDGTTNGNWAAGPMQHTNNDVGNGFGNGYAWWQDALGQDYAVESITIWNRLDCCTDRLNNFTVSLLNDGVTVWSATWNQSNGPIPNASFSVGATGDTVLVQLNRQDYLHMAEVEVFGVRAVPEPSTYALMALGLAGLAGAARRAGRR